MKTIKAAAGAVLLAAGVTLAAPQVAVASSGSSASLADQFSSALAQPNTSHPREAEEVRIGDRSYLIDVPENYDPAQSWPLLFGFSALGNTTEQFRDYSKLNQSTAGREAIIVYPRAIGASWENAPHAQTEPGEDLAFVQAIIDDVSAKYSIDSSRIYATGMSQGGGMAAGLACHMSDVFAGVSTVAGAFYHPMHANCGDSQVAFLAIHSVDDQLTRYLGGNNHGVNYYSVPEMFGHYEKRNGCAVPARV